jgi:hypothetical protein
MTITPYSISESTKISEAYLNNVLNEAKGVVKQGMKTGGRWLGGKAAKLFGGQVDDVVGGATRSATKNTPKSAVRGATKNADDVARGATKNADDVAKGATKNADDVAKGATKNADDVAKGATKNADDVAKGATKTAANKVDDLSRTLTPEEMKVLNPKIYPGRDAYNAVKAIVRGGWNAGKDAYNAGKAIVRGGWNVGKDVWKHTPRWAKVVAGTGATIAGGYAAADKLTDGGLSAAVRYFADVPSEKQRQEYNNVDQQNVDITRENNNQLNVKALMELEKGIGSGDGTAADTNHAAQVLYSMGFTDPNDSFLKPFPNARNVLNQVKESDDAAGIQESEAKKGIENAEKILSRHTPIPLRTVAPTNQSAMDDAVAKQAQERYQGIKLDPSAKSWSGNLKDFIFDNPYLTATVLTLPVLTYIISKHGAPLIDAIKRKGKNAVSGKEFVIVDNGKYLHSNGFSETVSKDIVIFKNRADAQSAIKALNAVTKSNYRIEELSKVIG